MQSLERDAHSPRSVWMEERGRTKRLIVPELVFRMSVSGGGLGGSQHMLDTITMKEEEPQHGTQ